MRDKVPPAAIPFVSALAAFLLAAAWSLTSAALLASPTSGHDAPVGQPTTVAQSFVTNRAASDDLVKQVGSPSTAASDSWINAAWLGLRHSSVARDGTGTTLASSVLSPRHPRRAVPPDRRVPLGTAVVGALLVGAGAGCARVRRTVGDPPRRRFTPPVESRAPPSGRLQVA
jgi:hypothetical protein